MREGKIRLRVGGGGSGKRSVGVRSPRAVRVGRVCCGWSDRVPVHAPDGSGRPTDDEDSSRDDPSPPGVCRGGGLPAPTGVRCLQCK